jgi:hypothetical protein
MWLHGKSEIKVEMLKKTGNIIGEQVTGDLAKQLSERFGKMMQERSSFSINRTVLLGVPRNWKLQLLRLKLLR